MTLDFLETQLCDFFCFLTREGQRSGAGQTFLDLGDLVLSLHVFCGGVAQVGGSVDQL